MTPKLDLDGLERLAKSAQKGPWETGHNTYSDWINSPGDCILAVDAETGLYRKPDKPTWEYIASASPQTILSLIAQARVTQEIANGGSLDVLDVMEWIRKAKESCRD